MSVAAALRPGVHRGAGSRGLRALGPGAGCPRLLSGPGLGAGGAGRFQRVIFWKLDRLARNLRDLLDICDGLEALEVGIVSIQEAIDTGTAAGRMIRSFLGAVAEFEREVITER